MHPTLLCHDQTMWATIKPHGQPAPRSCQLPCHTMPPTPRPCQLPSCIVLPSGHSSCLHEQVSYQATLVRPCGPCHAMLHACAPCGPCCVVPRTCVPHGPPLHAASTPCQGHMTYVPKATHLHAHPAPCARVHVRHVACTHVHHATRVLHGPH